MSESNTYHLRCNQCDHLNPVLNEYLTFCENCKKKLSNNFRDWQKINGDKSFDEFKKNVCEQVVPIQDEIVESAKKDGWKHWVNISITLAIILGLSPVIVPFFTFKSDLFVFFQETYVQGTDIEWTHYSFDDYGMSLDSPAELIHTQIPVPPEQERILLRMDAYSTQPTSLFGVIVVNNQFKEGIQGVNLQAMATSSLEQLRMIPGASNFQIEQSDTEIDGVAGFRQEGSFLLQGNQRGFISIGIAKHQMLWQVMAVYPLNDLQYKEASELMIESIRISYDSTI